MSLQVWLPLNGNLNNQGLSEVTVTNSGATVDSNGKIGSCYSFDAGKYLTVTRPVALTKEISYSCWVNISSWSSSSWDCILSLSTGTNWRDSRATLCRNGDRTNLTWNIANGSSQIQVNSNTSLSPNIWYHIVCTYDGAKLRIYINGVEDSSVSTSFVPNYSSAKLYIGSWNGNNYNLKGRLNDVRVYDHCLSAKEVKEISKGLICHYKLDNNGFGNPNLFSNSHFDSRYTVSDWDTSKNGNLCANSWGGYNGGVSNPSTAYHAHLQEHEGDYVYNYHKTSDEEWLGISQSITGRVEVNKTYTFSCELKRVSGKNYAHGGLYTRANSSATSNTFVNWFEFSEFASVTDNKWHKYSYTFTIDSSVYMTNGVSWYIYGTGGGDGEFLMRRPKLEEGSSATEWIPHTSDSLYTSLGLDSVAEADCSGLGNDGTKVGNIIYENSSVRYDGCYSFTGDDYIKIPKPLTISNSSYFTVSMWVKPEPGCGGYATVLSNFGNLGGFWIAINTEGSGTWFYNGTYAKGNPLLAMNQWHHIALVFNAGTVTWYTNGAATSTSNVSSGTTAFANYIAIGNSYTGTSWNTDFVGNISDVRIYSTALSASDIKGLYNTSASIDKNGNMYAYEFKEE